VIFSFKNELNNVQNATQFSILQVLKLSVLRKDIFCHKNSKTQNFTKSYSSHNLSFVDFSAFVISWHFSGFYFSQ